VPPLPPNPQCAQWVRRRRQLTFQTRCEACGGRGTPTFPLSLPTDLFFALSPNYKSLKSNQDKKVWVKRVLPDALLPRFQGLEGGVLIPHSHSFFTRIPHPALFSSLSRISFFLSQKYMKKD